jgi:hypothetical protein
MEFDGRRHDPRAHAPRNWGLLLLLVLCVEFWMIVASTVAHFI